MKLYRAIAYKTNEVPSSGTFIDKAQLDGFVQWMESTGHTVMHASFDLEPLPLVAHLVTEGQHDLAEQVIRKIAWPEGGRS